MSKEPSKQNEPGSNKFILGVAAFLALLLIVWLAQRRTAPKALETAQNSAAQVDSTSAKTFNRPTPSNQETNAEPEEPKENGPRAYLVVDFTDPNKSYENYKLSNVVVTAQGLTLAPGAESGSFESPSLALKMPSSMSAVLWKQEVPKGASVKVESCISGDNQNWSSWYPVEDTGDDINPIYPDGSPNPNYGFIPGGYVSTGLDLIPFVRYRFTLSNSGGDKEFRLPDGTFAQKLLIQKARIYHGDFAGTEGKLATPDRYPPGLPTPEEQARFKAEQAAAKPPASTEPPANP